MKKHLFTVCFIAVLTAFTVYIALDTFVISIPVDTDAGKSNLSMFEQRNSNENSEKISDSDESEMNTEKISDKESTLNLGGTLIGCYQNDNADIQLYEYHKYDTAVYVADIVLSSSQYLKTAFADDTYGKNVTAKTSSIAEQNDAVLAINGDYYGARESGYVIRNGIVYRNTENGEDMMCVYADGSMKIVSANAKTAEDLVAEGVWQAFCFGPALLEENQIAVSEKDEVGKAMASNPRTAVGMIDNCHYVFVVSDGRTNASEGLSLYQLAEFMRDLGVQTAYNLDGGGSSTIYFNGALVNHPTTSGRSIKERGVSDIVYIGK